MKLKTHLLLMWMPVVSTLFLSGCGVETSSVGSPRATAAVETATVKSTTETLEETTSIAESSESSVEISNTTAANIASSKVKENDSALNFYKSLEDNGVVDFTLNRSATAFLKSHPDLFPAGNTWNVSDDLIDYVSESEHISKSPDKYGDKLIYLYEVEVSQIKEEPYSGGRCTWLNVIDDNYNYYTIFYRGELPDVIKGSIIDVFALPLGASSFDNTGGGTTLTIALAGSNVTIHGSNTTNLPGANVYSGNTQQATPVQNLEESDYILPYSDSYYYTLDEVAYMDSSEVRIAINEIYARHGRMFDSADLQSYFNSKPWYHPTVPADQFDESVLNDFEKKNIKLLQPLR